MPVITQERFDKLYGATEKEGGYWVVPTSCACCKVCWLITRGRKAGYCVWNGPYRGYIEVKDG
jgi:hypothetical protein